MCTGSPQSSAKWGPGAPKSPGFSGEKKERPPFWSKETFWWQETCQLFQPLGSACSFPLSNIRKNNQGQQRPDGDVSCALALELVFFFQGPALVGASGRLTRAFPPILWILLDSEGSLGRGESMEERQEKKKKNNSSNDIKLVAEPGGKGELSEASWEPGAQRRSPQRLARVHKYHHNRYYKYKYRGTLKVSPALFSRPLLYCWSGSKVRRPRSSGTGRRVLANSRPANQPLSTGQRIGGWRPSRAARAPAS